MGEVNPAAAVSINYSYPLVIATAISAFGIGKALLNKKSTVLSVMDKYSFGIYLLHMAFIKYIFVFMKMDPWASPVWFAIAIAAAYLGSMGLTAIYKLF